MIPMPPTEPPPTPPVLPPLTILEGSLFLRRMRIATYGILLFVLVIHLLDKFRDILQPLFVAMFLGFLMQPIHRWLVQRGIRSIPAYGVILAVVMLGVLAIGSMMYANITQVAAKLPDFEKSIERKVADLTAQLPIKVPALEGAFPARDPHLSRRSPRWRRGAAPGALWRFHFLGAA